MRASYSSTSATAPDNQDTRPAAAPATVPQPVTRRIDWDAARIANHGCCCPAKPWVVAIFPPSAGRPHRTELLLCMHHFRVSRAELTAAGAAALDLDGNLIAREAPLYLAAVR